MSTLSFHAPPLPHYIGCGYDSLKAFNQHPARRSIGVFDLLIVRRGCFFIGEEEKHFEVDAGKALILLPDLAHYATRPSPEETHFYWLHFQSPGSWSYAGQKRRSQLNTSGYEVRAYSDVVTNAEAFDIEIPQFSTLETPETVYTLLDTLIDLGNQPQAIARWRQHLLFQSLLQELSRAYQPAADVGRQVAEQTAAFLRQHYREEISYALLKEQLHFHPSYLSRCMRRIFGVTPLEYLIDWRIEQSKRLLINTILPVSQVAGNVGFHHQSYFIRCFTRREGITPQIYRKQFSM